MDGTVRREGCAGPTNLPSSKDVTANMGWTNEPDSTFPPFHKIPPCPASWRALSFWQRAASPRPARVHLKISPSRPIAGEPITLSVSSQSHWIEVDTISVHDVELMGTTLSVTTALTAPMSELRFPGAKKSDLSIDIGSLARGVYDAHCEIYGEGGNLFTSASTSISVVPEPHALRWE